MQAETEETRICRRGCLGCLLGVFHFCSFDDLMFVAVLRQKSFNAFQVGSHVLFSGFPGGGQTNVVGVFAWISFTTHQDPTARIPAI